MGVWEPLLRKDLDAEGACVGLTPTEVMRVDQTTDLHWS